jgi:putative flippase GtrA
MDAVTDGRDETEAERIDRNLTELLQELRVAGIGTSVLFAFLLSLPFTNRFAELGANQLRLYVADLLLSALAIALMTAPVAHHRVVFRRHEKERVLQRANKMAIFGLAAAALSVSGSVLLILDVLYGGVIVAVLATLTAAVFGVLWFVLPFVDHRPQDY